MNNPLNPLDWLKTAQNWFSRTERSSGFRAYLIFLIIQIMFDLFLFTFLPNSPTVNIAPNVLYLSFFGFIILFAIKSFQDPNFCRSEKHIETVKKLEMMEQKGDKVPQVIDISKTMEIPSSEKLELADDSKRGEK